MSSKAIIRKLKEIRSDNTFNPYFERCDTYDAEDAPELRRHFLCEMLDRAADIELEAIWIGRDLGYRGGRRTGLALTDDVHYFEHLKRWGIAPQRPTYGQPVAERTAAVVWSVLSRLEAPVFLWNVFPLHPFESGDPFSNRAHNARERQAGIDILLSIIALLRPRHVVAIGNDAYNAVAGFLPHDQVFKVRHPSYGGQTEFLSTMEDIYQGSLCRFDLFSTCQAPH